jgi:hypothetical protein
VSAKDIEFTQYAATRWLTLVRVAMSPGLHPLGGRGPRPDNLAKVPAKVYASWSKVIKADHRDA